MRPARCQNLTSMKFWSCWRLHNKATDGNYDKRYYLLVYQTARKEVDSLKEYFKDLVMCLPDHEKVLDVVCKVEKWNRKKSLRRKIEVPVWHFPRFLSTCDAIFVIGGMILRLTALIAIPVKPNRPSIRQVECVQIAPLL